MTAKPTDSDTSGELESLDDLINKRQLHSSLSDQQPHENGIGSVSSADDPNASSLTIRPDSPPTRTARPRDESRWNGFHLWRTESHNARATRERDAAEMRQQNTRQRWLAGLVDSVREWYASVIASISTRKEEESRDENEKMSSVKMLLLTIVSAGTQLAWCLGFGYGTPYLLSIGFSKPTTSLVWLANPITGSVMQPLVGVLSDLSISPYRRRRYILLGTGILVPATLLLAFSTSVSSALIDVFRTGLADWDPARQEALQDMNKFIAVVSILFIYMSINILQPASRALILDVVPTSQHSRANAWNGRMTHIGNIGGYAAGWCDLSSWRAIAWVGGGQFRKCAVLSVIGVTICSLITSIAIKEDIRESSEGSMVTGFMAKMKEAFHHIWQTARRLPRPVRRICLVQFFALMGWFPFLFYATEWVIEIQERETGKRPIKGDLDDRVAEIGSLALLMFAIVALVSGTVLPYLSLSYGSSSKSIYLAGPEDESLPDDDRIALQEVKARRKSWRLTLRSIWTFSQLLYCIQALVLTFTVKTTNQAIGLLASIGIPWSVAQWIPFALVMESVREAEDGLSPFEFEADWFAPERVRGRRESGSAFARSRVEAAVRDCEPLLSNGKEPRQPSTFLARGTEVVGDNIQSPSRQQASIGVPVPLTNHNDNEGSPVAELGLGGTVLGIHNIAIVLPQLVFALLAAVILQNGPKQASQGQGDDGNGGVSVVWVIRAGGIAAFFAAVLTRFVPLTRTERLRRGQGMIGPEPRFDDEVTEDEAEPEEAETSS